jgi:hypothetical protein
MRTRILEELGVEHASLMAGARTDVPFKTYSEGWKEDLTEYALV